MKITPAEILLSVLLIGSIYRYQILERDATKIEEVSTLSPYVQYIEKEGPNIVVLFTSGAVYNTQNNFVSFLDSIIINRVTEKLTEEGYSIVTLNTPCLAGESSCMTEFSKIAIGILKLNPTAIIYKGVDSGLSLDAFNRIIQSEDIPIYSYGTEVALDYNLYTGPDNIGLGKKAFEGIESQVRPGDKAIYIETVRDVVTGESKDNGYPRINSIRNLMTKEGVEPALTIFSKWSEKITYDELITYFSSDKDIDYIIAPSQETALGAAIAIEESGVDAKIIVLDYGPEVEELLLSNRIYAAVSQGLIEQANTLVAKTIDPKSVTPKKVLFAPNFITKDTLKTTDSEELW
jgi:ABC-type sugar transport system substrate-binding protein